MIFFTSGPPREAGGSHSNECSDGWSEAKVERVTGSHSSYNYRDEKLRKALKGTPRIHTQFPEASEHIPLPQSERAPYNTPSLC